MLKPTTAETAQLLLVNGESGTGKSACLRNIPNQDRWLYLNTEAGKRLPFKNNFVNAVVTDPHQLKEGFDTVTGNPAFDGIIIDSLTFLMEMYESAYVLTAEDSRGAWQNYAQYFKKMMQDWVAKCDKHVIFTAHTLTTTDKQLNTSTSVPVKGALKNNGLESYFSTIVATKSVQLSQLEAYSSDLLNITEEDKLVGYKHVFQTKLTKDTVGERIRGTMGLFSVDQTFVDNDVAMLLEHMIDHLC